MSVRLQYSSVASETGPLLERYLKDRRIYNENAEAVVCYGQPARRAQRAINGNCARGKIFNMEAMTAAGVRLVPWFKGERIPAGMKFPLLARKVHGHGGTDIVPVFQPKEVPWRIAAGWDWFSSHVPTDTEYRVWAWRGQHLDTYEKKMVREGCYTGVTGRNYANGFDFVPAGQMNDATREAVRALESLDYDFGAVDMLRGEDGQIYVLEVNSAPGVIKSGAQGTLGKLADKIAEWDAAGHPRR